MIISILSVVLSGSAGQVSPLTHAGFIDEQLRAPTRVYVAPDDSILVADPTGKKIVRYSAAGAFLDSWNLPSAPVGVAAHPDGRFFVSLLDSASVEIFDSNFLPLGPLGVGNPMVTFARPTMIDIASDTGRIYVVDSLGDRVYVFESDGSLALLFGVHGELVGEFLYPSAIAVNEANGRVVVADQDNYRIQVFTTQGVFVTRFGYRNKYLPTGDQEGWMPRTSGVAVDSIGQVYVADALMSTVRIFDPSGAELGKVLDYGSGTGDLRTPADLALSNDGLRLYVANLNAGRIEIYDTPSFSFPGDPPVATATIGTNANAYDDARRTPGIDGSTVRPAKRIRPMAERRQKGEVAGAESTAFQFDDSATEYDGPHMTDASIVCGRCHGINDQPGGHVGLLEGQVVMCLSCHNAGGQAMSTPLHEWDVVDGSVEPGRSHKWGVLAVDVDSGSTGPTPGGIMDQYLTSGGMIKCSTCHDQHSQEAGTPYLRVQNSNGSLCKECHVDAVKHTPSGSWQPDCLECHRPHDKESANLALIGSSVENVTLGVSKPVQFVSRLGPGSFSDGDPAQTDGICQVCHTATNYHRHDGTGAAHNEATTCTDCHPHAAGFIPTGGSCTGCHAGVQDDGDGIPVGGRRAVVGEFPVDDLHAHYGTALDDAACVVCHDQTTHMDGNVDLIDPDSGALYTFVTPDQLTSDPDLSDFCAACHDADGAARLATPNDPFGNGNTPPDVASRFQGTLQWDQMYGDFCFGDEGTLRRVNSHHDISDADQSASGAKIECLNCHGAHNVSATQPLADPFNTHVAWGGTGNGFCLQCHGGGTGPLDPGFPSGVFGPVIDPTDPTWATLGMDWTTIQGGACLTQACSSLRGLDSCDYVEGPWYVDYSWTHSTHGANSKRGWTGYSGAPDADMDCQVCHDPHGSWTPANAEGNPYMIRDTIDGTAYVDDGTRTGGFNGPPFNTFGSVQVVDINVSGLTVDWGGATGLCGACHVDWLAAYDFHGFCDSCQTCHGHGMAWNEADWEDFDDDTPCPIPSFQGMNPDGLFAPANDGTVSKIIQGETIPLHQLGPKQD